jgi:thiamine-monophosphate kinase
MRRRACAAPRCSHGTVDEFELIRRYFARPGDAPGVVLGVGDDGAVMRPEPGRDLVTVIDTLVEGIHFHADIPPGDLGYRVVAVNLSDIAAMGARPLWMTLALTLPGKPEQWVNEFSHGLFEAADEQQVSLVGGDLTSGDTLVATVQVTGDVASGAAVSRKGAQPGDSDGLVGDLKKLLDASQVGCDLDLDALPLSEAMIGAFDANQRLQFAATGGDDYELCFTSAKTVPGEIAGVAVTAIGTITERAGLDCRSGGRIVEVDDSGYRHFQ